MRFADWCTICNELMVGSFSRLTCVSHFTLSTMVPRLLLMAGGMDENLCVQLNSNTGSRDSIIRALTCVGSGKDYSRHYREDGTYECTRHHKLN